MLRVSAKAHGVTGIPTRVGGTRWVPHLYLSLTNFWKLFPALFQHFGEVLFTYWPLVYELSTKCVKKM
jgi:hypothetical protein